MSRKYHYDSIPRLGGLIEDCIARNIAIMQIVSNLKRFDPAIISFVSEKYIKGIKSRREKLHLTKKELANSCNVSLEFINVIESKFKSLDYHKLENTLEYMRYDRTTRCVLRSYKQEFPNKPFYINKHRAYVWLVKTLIHQVLLEEELRRKTIDISKSKEIPLTKIYDSLLGLDRVRYV